MANNKNITFDQLEAAMTKVKTALDATINSHMSSSTHVTYATAAPLVAGSAAVGTSSRVAREDHVHPLQTSVSGSSGSCTGNAATATKLKDARTISLTGAVSGSTTFDGSGNASISTTFKYPTSGSYWNNGAMIVSADGVAEAGKYIDFHNTSASTNDYDLRLQVSNANRNVVTLPGATGTLALTNDNVASATKLQNARTISLSGDVTGSTSFDGSGNVTINTSRNDTLFTTNVSNNTLSLSNKRYQYTTISSNTTITLPNVSTFTEIHLFFNWPSGVSITMPSNVTWQGGVVYGPGYKHEFIFTYVNSAMGWLGGCVLYE